jgi:hypothetical protein
MDLRMQLTVTVSDQIGREAEARGMLLVDKGFAEVSEHDTVSSAIQRIRALRSSLRPFEPR